MSSGDGQNSTVGRHYAGEAGAAYFSWQNATSGEMGGRLNARKFNAYLQPDSTVVDFGCGAGYMLEKLLVRERIGIEPAPAARKAATGRGLRVVASAHELPSESVDTVVSNHALEHAVEPVQELREVCGLLKPDGQLRLWVPIDDWRADRRDGQRREPPPLHVDAVADAQSAGRGGPQRDIRAGDNPRVATTHGPSCLTAATGI